MTSSVVGRFAPSPTGPLHFGSLVAAVGSYLNAKAQGGRWLVRIDDLDPPREVDGAADQILTALEKLSLEWDGSVLYQSQRHAAYNEAIDALARDGKVFYCNCTRRSLGTGPYPGTCRELALEPAEGRSIRVIVNDDLVTVNDLVQEPVNVRLSETSGDFIIRRRDGLFAYHLAAVIDDAASGVTEVIRGADLLSSTPQQVYLQQLLGFSRPVYGHLPVARDRQGNKLSKQTGADAIDPRNAPALMSQALEFLGFRLPREVAGSLPREQLAWARSEWQLSKLPKTVAPA